MNSWKQKIADILELDYLEITPTLVREKGLTSGKYKATENKFWLEALNNLVDQLGYNKVYGGKLGAIEAENIADFYQRELLRELRSRIREFS